MAKGRRTPNQSKVDLYVRGDLRRFPSVSRPMPLVPGINGMPLCPSVSPRKPTMRGEQRAKAVTCGEAANGANGYSHTYVTSRGEVFDRETKMPLGYRKPYTDTRVADLESEVAAEDRERMLRRQWEVAERARIIASQRATR